MIAIIDYGAGNLQSVVKALNHIECENIITNDRETLINCDGAILPGVGAFGDAAKSMKESKIDEAIKEYINTGKPFLGICLGLQLLFPESDESKKTDGLDILKGSITKIPNKNRELKIPHIGWNSLKIRDNKEGIYKNIDNGSYVYFVHSYYLEARNKEIVTATTEYGVTIDASVQKENIIAVQFHPEKSGKVGLQMLRNFVEITNSKKGEE